MKCERCGKGTEGFELHDFCAVCGKNLCEGCMEKGCCGNVPASSGMEEAEEAEAAEQLQEEEAEQLKDADFATDSGLPNVEGQQGEIGQ
jgi:hypothetical protein